MVTKPAVRRSITVPLRTVDVPTPAHTRVRVRFLARATQDTTLEAIRNRAFLSTTALQQTEGVPRHARTPVRRRRHVLATLDIR